MKIYRGGSCLRCLNGSYGPESMFVIIHCIYIIVTAIELNCETLTSKETVEIPVTSTCLSVVYPYSKKLIVEKLLN
jgi:hypothetical protein